MTSSPSSSAPKSKYDVIIIGAGLSGLACGYDLVTKTNKKRVLILEAKDRIGGRVHTVELGDGDKDGDGKDGKGRGRVELGASMIHGTYGNPVTELAKKLGLEFTLDQPMGKIFKSDGTQISQEKYEQVFFNVFNTVFTVARSSSSNSLSPPSKSLSSYLFSPESPLFDDIENEEEKTLVKECCNIADGWNGSESENVSFKWWGFEREFKGPDAILLSGYSRIAEHLASPFQITNPQAQSGTTSSSFEPGSDSQIHLSSPVTNIHLSKLDSQNSEEDEDEEETQEVVVRTSRGEEFQADHVVFTASLGVLKHLIRNDKKQPRENGKAGFFYPPLEKRKLGAIERLGFGLLNKLVISYPYSWWPPETSLFLLLPCPGSHSNSDSETKGSIKIPAELEFKARMILGPLKSNSSSPSTSHLTLFVGGLRAGKALESLTDSEAQFWIDRDLKRYLKNWTESKEGREQRREAEGGGKDKDEKKEDPPIPEPNRVIVTRWFKDEWVRGSYAFTPVTPENSALSSSSKEQIECTPLDYIELSKPTWDGRLRFAGEATEVDCFASAHGAIISGRREASNILASLDG